MKNNIFIICETLTQSILADTFSFFMISGLLLFNHRLLSGHVLVDLCFIFMAWLVIASKGKKKVKRFNTKAEAIKFLEES